MHAESRKSLSYSIAHKHPEKECQVPFIKTSTLWIVDQTFIKGWKKSSIKNIQFQKYVLYYIEIFLWSVDFVRVDVGSTDKESLET